MGRCSVPKVACHSMRKLKGMKVHTSVVEKCSPKMCSSLI